jgi:chemotaxis protein CheC
MEDISLEFSEKFVKYLQAVANEGVNNAAQGFSGMLGCTLEVSEPNVKLVGLSEIPGILGGPENEAVGIYLRAEGDIPAQIMLIIPYDRAMELVDMLLGEPSGTTTMLGKMERSALAEVGNLTGTFFMNSFAKMANADIRPTPPAVMVDMVGAIMDIIIATTGGVSDKVLMMQAKFDINDREVMADFWVIPDQNTLEALEKRL